MYMCPCFVSNFFISYINSPLRFHGIIHMVVVIFGQFTQFTVVVVIAFVQYTSVNGLWVPAKS